MNIKDTAAAKHFDEFYSGQSTDKKLYICASNRSGQLLRFKAVSEIGNFNNRSILDVGCGLGEFYYFCAAKGESFEYVGIDIDLRVVKEANKYYPIKILHMDMLENNFDSNSFDYVIASLLFCFEMDNWNERTQLLVKEMYRVSRLGVAMNFLRFREENRNLRSHYVKYDDITKIVERCTNSYIIRSNYKKNDFTIYMYKKLLRT